MEKAKVSVVSVTVVADDPVTRSGISGSFGERPEVRLVAAPAEADVAVIAFEKLDDDGAKVVRSVRQDHGCRVVVVLADVNSSGLLAAVEAGANGLLRRVDASTEALVSAVRGAAAGDGTLPPDLLGRLLEQVGRLQRQVLEPQSMRLNGLDERELQVLRLAAEGHGTAHIARQLAFSERTIKNVVHDVTVRLGVRNRTHAVAYAIREGMI